jgi:ribosome biogenesis GTPase A
MKQIQWYPGHMAKTRREVKEHVKHIDVVLELLDARMPLSSRNPDLMGLVGHKPRVVLLNKADLADASELDRWVEYFRNEGAPALPIRATSGIGLDRLLPIVRDLLADKQRQELAKGRSTRAVRAMILGIPNVGKSTLINTLAGKKKRNVEDRPGVTRETQYIRVGDDFELLDTPGILWPKFEDKDVAFKLAIFGAIKDDILPKDDVVIAAFRYLDTWYKGRLEERYDIQVDIDDILGLFDGIGRRRGCLLPGNEIDYDRVCDIVLYDLRQGRLGPLTFDRVDNLV